MNITITGTAAEIIDFAETLKQGLAYRASVVTPEILAALSRGRIIEAIKIRRAQSGDGLKDAKDFIESLPQYPPARIVAGLQGREYVAP